MSRLLLGRVAERGSVVLRKRVWIVDELPVLVRFDQHRSSPVRTSSAAPVHALHVRHGCDPAVGLLLNPCVCLLHYAIGNELVDHCVSLIEIPLSGLNSRERHSRLPKGLHPLLHGGVLNRRRVFLLELHHRRQQPLCRRTRELQVRHRLLRLRHRLAGPAFPQRFVRIDRAPLVFLGLCGVNCELGLEQVHVVLRDLHTLAQLLQLPADIHDGAAGRLEPSAWRTGRFFGELHAGIRRGKHGGDWDEFHESVGLLPPAAILAGRVG